jgi:mitochondrial protein MBA1
MVSWNIEKYHRSPSTFFTGVRVLSDRATPIPDFPDSGIRQIVLRISSQQSRETYSSEYGALEGLPPPAKIQDCTEYIVIQKVRINGFEKDWQIWGYTKPTTLEDLDSPHFATNITFKERVQALQDMMSGGKR